MPRTAQQKNRGHFMVPKVNDDACIIYILRIAKFRVQAHSESILVTKKSL